MYSPDAPTGIMAILHRVREEYPGMPIRSVGQPECICILFLSTRSAKL